MTAQSRSTRRRSSALLPASGNPRFPVGGNRCWALSATTTATRSAMLADVDSERRREHEEDDDSARVGRRSCVTGGDCRGVRWQQQQRKWNADQRVRRQRAGLRAPAGHDVVGPVRALRSAVSRLRVQGGRRLVQHPERPGRPEHAAVAGRPVPHERREGDPRRRAQLGGRRRDRVGRRGAAERRRSTTTGSS